MHCYLDILLRFAFARWTMIQARKASLNPLRKVSSKPRYVGCHVLTVLFWGYSHIKWRDARGLTKGVQEGMPLCLAIKVSLINMSLASLRRVGPRANKEYCKMGDAKLTTPLKKLETWLANLFSYMYVHLYLSCFIKVGAKILIYCYCFVSRDKVLYI